MTAEPRPRDFALVALGGVLWGTGGLAGAALADAADLAPLTVAAYRLLGGGGVLLLGLAAAGALRGFARTRPVVVRVLATALLAAVYQAAYFAAVQRAGVAVATLVALGAAPLAVAAGSTVSTRRLPAPRTLAALGLALAGLVLLVRPSEAGPRAAVGALLALLAAVAFATMTVLNRRGVPGLGPLPLTATAFTLGGAALLPVAALTGSATTGLAVPSDVDGWLLLAYLAVVPTAAAYGAYFTGLRHVPATTAALLVLLEPLTATVGAVLLRGEQLGLHGVLGAGLVGAAVVVLRPRRAGSPTMDAPGRAAGHLSRSDAARAGSANTSGVVRASDPREGPAPR
ncbi:DMT family transporter [Cellulomonas fengjieae]|uniref:DMT family transporter n=1 Tax=Cellulomonas fengjieae TaxID=2819978 RepID=UPI001AAE2787|nr:DMT family transporter [Cellulomonas fengjieae]MBO3101358.1 DMT family transporter [Cellulomonas fengjieae]